MLDHRNTGLPLISPFLKNIPVAEPMIAHLLFSSWCWDKVLSVGVKGQMAILLTTARTTILIPSITIPLTQYAL